MFVRPIVGALLLAVGLTCGLVLGPSSAGASNGDFVVMGGLNHESTSTKIDTTGPCCDPALIVSGGATIGIRGESSAGTGVVGDGPTGVFGQGGSVGVWGRGDDIGVQGENVFEGDGVLGKTHEGGAGVHGVTYAAAGDGEGVFGESMDDSTGVYGLTNSGLDAGSGVLGVNMGEGPAVNGSNEGHGNGVQGSTNSQGASGVYGRNDGNGPGVLGENFFDGNGVQGNASNAIASGVYGSNTGTGYGVAGRANVGVGLFGDSATGTGVVAHSPSGVALSVQGVMTASRSGLATVLAGRTTVVVSLNGVKGAFVLATVQGKPAGVWVESVELGTKGGGQLTIHLNAAAAANVKVGWFALG
jgi:hypothetical protein